MKELTTVAEVQGVIESGEKVCVDFYATWCGPCKDVIKNLTELDDEYSDVTFYKVNVGECYEVAEHYQIQSLPVILFANMKESQQEPERLVGKQSKQNLEAKLS
jgi:thioredoxin 1